MQTGMNDDGRNLWAEETRERLTTWANWTRGNQLVRGSKNVLADMIKRAAGEVPGLDTSVGYEFTFEIEVTDKAVARLKVDAQALPWQRRRYMKQAKRVLMSVYLGRRTPAELARQLNCPAEHIKSQLWFAECYVGRAIPEVEKTVAKLRACR